jgi:hypothetical protein
MHGFYYGFRDTLSAAVYYGIKPVAKFLVPDWWNIVDNPMLESTISPQSVMKNLAFGQTVSFCCIVGWGSVSVDFIFMTMLGSKEKNLIFFSSIKRPLILTFILLILQIYKNRLHTNKKKKTSFPHI